MVVRIGWTYVSIFFPNKMQALEYLKVSFLDALSTDPQKVRKIMGSPYKCLLSSSLVGIRVGFP